MGSWSLEFKDITKSMVLEDIKQQSGSKSIPKKSVPADILGPRGEKSSMEIKNAINN